jgi:hypothetical protein
LWLFVAEDPAIVAVRSRMAGSTAYRVTNVTRPLGAVTVALVTLAVLRYANEVERAVRTTRRAIEPGS